MTEVEWLACEDPQAMRELLRFRSSDRKLRLFATACCRMFSDCHGIDAIREVIEVNERFADKQATDEELSRARGNGHSSSWDATWKNERTGDPTVQTIERMFFAMFMVNIPARLEEDRMPMLRSDPELLHLSPILLRCIFGNPFRPVIFDPSRRTSTVVALANQMYESRDFSPMPILADALQDAGCDHPDILAHCRDPQPAHVRGCWVVDLILGKE